MTETRTLSFTPEGWLDSNVVRFWEERDEVFIKLFSQEVDEPQIEATFYPETRDNGSDRWYNVHRNDRGEVDLISILVGLPEARYWTIHEILARNQEALARIEVDVTYESADESPDEAEVVELQIGASIGDYFSRPPTLGRRRR